MKSSKPLINIYTFWQPGSENPPCFPKWRLLGWTTGSSNSRMKPGEGQSEARRLGVSSHVSARWVSWAGNQPLLRPNPPVLSSLQAPLEDDAVEGRGKCLTCRYSEWSLLYLWKESTYSFYHLLAGWVRRSPMWPQLDKSGLVYMFRTPPPS